MALIGILGKSLSGKDTVGKIIQYLTSEVGIKGTRTFEEAASKIGPDGYGYANFTQYNSPFEIKKNADSLKEMLCILLGCSRADLENEEFKNKELGEEWWYFKSSDGEMFPYLDNLKFKEMPDKFLEKLTPRKILLLLGTKCGRNIIHPNIWVNSLMSKYKQSEDYQEGTTPENLKWVEGVYPDWVITDVRFPNEVTPVEKEGFTIKVERSFQLRYPKEVLDYMDNGGEYKSMNAFIASNYPKIHEVVSSESETSLDDYTAKYTINNKGSLEDLIAQVTEVLIKEKVL